MDGSFLETFNPIITSGAGKIDKSVYMPATVTDIKKDAQVIPLNNNFRSDAALRSLQEVERSMAESSTEPQLQGRNDQLPGTARQSILLQQNAETNLGFMARMIGVMVKEVGELMIDDIVRHQTIGEVGEIIGDVPRMKYLSFVVENKIKDGKNKTHVIKFTDRYSGVKISTAEREARMMELKTEAGDDREISEVNPGLFSRLNFLVSVDYEQMMTRNTAFERAFKLETYDKAISNPLIMNDPEAMNAVTRDFLLEPLVKGDASKYLPKVMEGVIPPAGPPGAQNVGAPSSRLAQSVMKEGVGRELSVNI